MLGIAVEMPVQEEEIDEEVIAVECAIAMYKLQAREADNEMAEWHQMMAESTCQKAYRQALANGRYSLR